MIHANFSGDNIAHDTQTGTLPAAVALSSNSAAEIIVFNVEDRRGLMRLEGYTDQPLQMLKLSASAVVGKPRQDFVVSFATGTVLMPYNNVTASAATPTSELANGNPTAAATYFAIEVDVTNKAEISLWVQRLAGGTTTNVTVWARAAA
jgi:hypothetical protein